MSEMVKKSTMLLKLRNLEAHWSFFNHFYTIPSALKFLALANKVFTSNVEFYIISGINSRFSFKSSKCYAILYRFLRISIVQAIPLLRNSMIFFNCAASLFTLLQTSGQRSFNTGKRSQIFGKYNVIHKLCGFMSIFATETSIAVTVFRVLKEWWEPSFKKY